MEGKIKPSEIYYAIFFVLLFTTRILGVVEGNMGYNITLLVGAVCFILSNLMNSDSLFIRICDLGLLMVVLLAYVLSGEKGLLLFFAMMIGARVISVERLFRISLLVAGTAYVVMIFLCVFSFIQDKQYYQLATSVGDILRRSISFLQLNVIMVPYLVFMMMVLYLYKDENKRRTVSISILLFVGLIYLFIYSFAKTVLIVGTLLLVLNYYYRFKCKFSLLTRILAHGYYLLCTFIGIICPVLYEGEIFGGEGNTHFLSWLHRLYIGHYYWINNSVSLFGQRLNDPDPESVIYPLIHQSQLYLLLQYGLILFLVVNLLYHIAIEDMIKRKAGTEIAIVLSYATIGIVEPLLFNLSFKNISFIFVGLAYTSFIKLIEGKLKVKTKIIAPLMRFNHAFSYSIDYDKWKERLTVAHQKTKQKRLFALVGLFAGFIIIMIMTKIALPKGAETDGTIFMGFEYGRFVITAVVWSAVLSGAITPIFAVVKAVRTSRLERKRY